MNDVKFSEPGYASYPDPGEYYPSSSSYEKYVSFNEKDISTTGDTTIVIKATGYKDLTIVINKDGQLVSQGSGEVGDSDQETGKDAPAIVKYAPASMWGGNKIYFDDEQGTYEIAAKAYVGAITSVTVNRTDYTRSDSSLSLEDDMYYAYINATASHLELSTSKFSTSANTTITIKADGYKDLTITIGKNGSIV